MAGSKIEEILSDWKDWIDGPLGHAIRGATYGGGLGWIYDKWKDKKGKGSESLKRIATGALLGSLSESALHNYMQTRKPSARNLLRKIEEIRAGRTSGS